MPPGAKKKNAAKLKKELERKERLALQSRQHQDHLQQLPTHGNGHHHEEEEEKDGRDSEARSPTHNSSHDSHQSSQSEAEDCEEKSGNVMAAEEESCVPPVVVGEEEKHQVLLPASESIAKAEDVIVVPVTDEGANDEKPGEDGSRVAPATDEAMAQGDEIENAVPEAASANYDGVVKYVDLEEHADSAVVVARQDDEVGDGVPENASAIQVVRQEDEVGDRVPEGNVVVEVVRQDDAVRVRALEESSVIDVIQQIDEVKVRVHEECSAVEAVREIDEIADQVASEISALVKPVDEVKFLEQKLVEIILPPDHEAVEPSLESSEAKTEAVPNASDGVINQPQECHETCCGNNSAAVLQATKVVPLAPLVAERTKWWNCCGLFDVFVGSN